MQTIELIDFDNLLFTQSSLFSDNMDGFAKNIDGSAVGDGGAGRGNCKQVVSEGKMRFIQATRLLHHNFIQTETVRIKIYSNLMIDLKVHASNHFSGSVVKRFKPRRLLTINHATAYLSRIGKIRM